MQHTAMQSSFLDVNPCPAAAGPADAAAPGNDSSGVDDTQRDATWAPPEAHKDMTVESRLVRLRFGGSEAQRGLERYCLFCRHKAAAKLDGLACRSRHPDLNLSVAPGTMTCALAPSRRSAGRSMSSRRARNSPSCTWKASCTAAAAA